MSKTNGNETERPEADRAIPARSARRSSSGKIYNCTENKVLRAQRYLSFFLDDWFSAVRRFVPCSRLQKRGRNNCRTRTIIVAAQNDTCQSIAAVPIGRSKTRNGTHMLLIIFGDNEEPWTSRRAVDNFACKPIAVSRIFFEFPKSTS